MQKVGEKTKLWNLEDKLYCPGQVRQWIFIFKQKHEKERAYFLRAMDIFIHRRIAIDNERMS